MLARLYKYFGKTAPVPLVGNAFMEMAKTLEGKAVLYHAIVATDHLGSPFWWDVPDLEPRDYPNKYDLQGRLTHLPTNRFIGVKILYYPCPFAARSWMEFEIIESFTHPLTVKDWQTIVMFRFPSLFRANRLTGRQPDLSQLRRATTLTDEAQRLAGKFVCFIFGKSDMPDLDQCFDHWGTEDIFAALIAAGPSWGPSLLSGRALPESLRVRVEKYWAATTCC